MTRSSGKRPPRDGYILVAVLGVMLLLTSLMAAGSLLVRSALHAAGVGDAQVAMSGLARGGIELTAYQLFIAKSAPGAIDGRPLRFGAGVIVPHLGDEASKADLNDSDAKLLAAVFQSAGLDARTVGDLVTYVVAARGPYRNPATGPETAALPSMPPNPKMRPRGFQSVDQLAEVSTLSRSDLRAIRPFLTVFNPDGKINVLSASREMLLALPGVAPADAEVILERRNSGDKKQIEAILSRLGEAKAFVKTTYGPAFGVRVDATSATGRKNSVHAVLAASKSPNVPYYVLNWWE